MARVSPINYGTAESEQVSTCKSVTHMTYYLRHVHTSSNRANICYKIHVHQILRNQFTAQVYMYSQTQKVDHVRHAVAHTELEHTHTHIRSIICSTYLYSKCTKSTANLLQKKFWTVGNKLSIYTIKPCQQFLSTEEQYVYTYSELVQVIRSFYSVVHAPADQYMQLS